MPLDPTGSRRRPPSPNFPAFWLSSIPISDVGGDNNNDNYYYYYYYHYYHHHNNSNNNNNNRIQRHNSRFFFTISSLRREPSPTRMLKWPRRNRVQTTWNTSNAHHVQQVVLRVTWYEGIAQLLSITMYISHLFELYSISWTINQWRSGGKRSTWRKALATSYRKCHILKPEDSTPNRDSNPQAS